MSCCRRCAVLLSPRRPRIPLFAPALASHQQLDAGIAARHQADRKSLKRSRRPFDNYFRAEYRTSPAFRGSVARTDGTVSAFAVARLMTDARRGWAPFWGRAAGGGVRTRRKRQDVLEPPARQFGEDGLDRVVERLLELRFQWDRDDDILATSLVPPSLRAATEHCRPFARHEGTAAPLHSGNNNNNNNNNNNSESEREAEGSMGPDGEIAKGHAPVLSVENAHIPAAVLRRVRGRRKGPKAQSVGHGLLGFSGVDTIPSIVLDAARGPLVSSPTESALALRWRATNREATSVSEVLRLRQTVSGVSAVGLTPRALLLLLKAHATAEIEDPALDVALAIAVGEHYNEFSATECLEALRCLRRVATVRGMHCADNQMRYTNSSARFANANTNTSTNASTNANANFNFNDALDVLPLYSDAACARQFLGAYLQDAAPFLADRVWSRLPEQVQRLTRRGFALDLADLLSLALETRSSGRMPSHLPNTASAAPYAAKFFFLRHTLGLDAAAMESFAACLSAAAAQPAAPGDPEDETELSVKPFALWLCVALLARLTAEALGDVLRHVEDSMRRHVRPAQCPQRIATRSDAIDIEQYLDRIALARPQRHCVFQRIGRRRPKRMRLRLIPLEAFPEIFRHARTPYEAETRQAHRSMAQQQRERHEKANEEVSPLVDILAQSVLAEQHIRRACDALDWATMVLTHGTAIVRSIPTPAKQAQNLISASSAFTTQTVEVAVGDRFVCCEAFVRSRVQSDVDCLFLYVPWQGLEEQMQTIAEAQRSAKAQSDKVPEEMAHDPNAGFLLELLTCAEPVGSGAETVGGEEETSRAMEEKAIAVTVAHSAGTGGTEARAREILENLQENVERFQVAVADLIDAQEEFFLMV